MPGSAEAGDIETGGRWRCMRRKGKPWNRSNIAGWRVRQIDPHLEETRSRYDSWQNHRTMGLGKQNPGEVANELGALDWERPATRGHDGLTVSTQKFLRAE